MAGKARAQHKAFPLASFKAVEGDAAGDGVFEALVSTFGNVDRMGDRVMPGAFKESLAAWEGKGRPIPVIFSHEWDNLDAHIGEVLKAEEREDGLWVKAQLDMEEPFAQRVFKKMKRGTLAEFSFSYDILDAKTVNQVNELRKLELLEVGPCLVGVNPETQLLGVKGGEAERGYAALQGKLQQAHDLLVELGAKCAQPEEDADGADEDDGEGEAGADDSDGKSKTWRLGTLAARVEAELLAAGAG